MPVLRSKAWISELRLRSAPISGRASGMISIGGAGTARSCILRASLAETATGPAGTWPLRAAGDFPALSPCRERRSMRRRGGRCCTSGPFAAAAGAATGGCTVARAGAWPGATSERAGAAMADTFRGFKGSFSIFRIQRVLAGVSSAARKSRARFKAAYFIL